MPRAWLDEAALVHIAAVATGQPPASVLAGADVRELAWVAAELEGEPTAVEAAAVALLEVGHRRPFGDGSTAAAWLAAAHLLAAAGLRLRIGPIGAAGVLATSPRLSVADAAAVLREHSVRRRPWLGWLVQGSWPDGPSVLPCPACGRPVIRRRTDLVDDGLWAEAALTERVARCAMTRGEHGRWAGPMVPAPALTVPA
jgi:hypothetical protein